MELYEWNKLPKWFKAAIWSLEVLVLISIVVYACA